MCSFRHLWKCMFSNITLKINSYQQSCSSDPGSSSWWRKKKRKREASGFTGWAGEGKITTELFLWRTWSWFLLIVPSPEEHRAPLTDSSSLVQSPPLCAEWTAHSALPPPHSLHLFQCLSHTLFLPQSFKVKRGGSSQLPPRSLPSSLLASLSHLFLPKALCALDRHMLFFLKHLLPAVSVCSVLVASVPASRCLRLSYVKITGQQLNGWDLLLPWCFHQSSPWNRLEVFTVSDLEM